MDTVRIRELESQIAFLTSQLEQRNALVIRLREDLDVRDRRLSEATRKLTSLQYENQDLISRFKQLGISPSLPVPRRPHQKKRKEPVEVCDVDDL